MYGPTFALVTKRMPVFVFDGATSPDEYRYYFRAGFRRGYEDGYSERYEYGRYADGKYTILAEVLPQILNLQSF